MPSASLSASLNTLTQFDATLQARAPLTVLRTIVSVTVAACRFSSQTLVTDAGALAVLAPALRRSGVRPLTGTDTENSRIKSGESFHDEMELLVLARFSPLEVLRGTTSNALTIYA